MNNENAPAQTETPDDLKAKAEAIAAAHLAETGSAPTAPPESSAPAEPAPFSAEWFDAALAANTQQMQAHYDAYRQLEGVVLMLQQQRALAVKE